MDSVSFMCSVCMEFSAWYAGRKITYMEAEEWREEQQREHVRDGCPGNRSRDRDRDSWT